MTTSSPRDDNRIAGLIAKSDADNTPVVVEADPTTKRLKVTATVSSIVGSGIATEATLAKLNEFEIPVFDTQVIDESASPATTTITYKKSGATVATKTITVVGTTTTISVV